MALAESEDGLVFPVLFSACGLAYDFGQSCGDIICREQQAIAQEFHTTRQVTPLQRLTWCRSPVEMSASGRMRRFRRSGPATVDLGRPVTVKLTHDPGPASRLCTNSGFCENETASPTTAA